MFVLFCKRCECRRFFDVLTGWTKVFCTKCGSQSDCHEERGEVMLEG